MYRDLWEINEDVAEIIYKSKQVFMTWMSPKSVIQVFILAFQPIFSISIHTAGKIECLYRVAEMFRKSCDMLYIGEHVIPFF